MTSACPCPTTGVRETLTEKIIHLGEKMELIRNQGGENKPELRKWRQAWSEENSLLKMQFAKLEEKLASLSGTQKQSHHLSIFEDTPDTDGMTTMGPF